VVQRCIFLYNYLHTNFISVIRHPDDRHYSERNLLVNNNNINNKNNNNNTAELHLSGLNATASHPDTQKIRMSGFFFENTSSLHRGVDVENNF